MKGNEVIPKKLYVFSTWYHHEALRTGGALQIWNIHGMDEMERAGGSARSSCKRVRAIYVHEKMFYVSYGTCYISPSYSSTRSTEFM